jgi:hypothetical protein
MMVLLIILNLISQQIPVGFPLYYYNAKKGDTPEYYDIVVTKTIKNIVEGKDGTTTQASNDPLFFNLGAFVKILVTTEYLWRKIYH